MENIVIIFESQVAHYQQKDP